MRQDDTRNKQEKTRHDMTRKKQEKTRHDTKSSLSTEVKDLLSSKQ